MIEARRCSSQPKCSVAVVVVIASSAGVDLVNSSVAIIAVVRSSELATKRTKRSGANVSTKSTAYLSGQGARFESMIINFAPLREGAPQK